MPVVYRFRVRFEDYDDISRDIEIKSVQTFEEFNDIIQSSIGFDNSKHASFYMSNDYWIKGQEISKEERTDKAGNKSMLMASSRICDFITDPHQKIYYISDYEANWSFFIELVKIIPQGDAMRNYPVCIKSTGDAPKQFIVINTPKVTAAEDEEFEKLINDDYTAPEEETEETLEQEEEIADEEDTGVEMELISQMSEEGEEEESEQGSGEEEGEAMDYSDEEDSQKDY